MDTKKDFLSKKSGFTDDMNEDILDTFNEEIPAKKKVFNLQKKPAKKKVLNLQKNPVKKKVLNLKKKSASNESDSEELDYAPDNFPINFTDIFILDLKDLIKWCVKTGFLKKPSFCYFCYNEYGIRNCCKLSGSKNYIDKYCWKCKDKTCKRKINIRKGNKILENFPKIKLKILLVYILTHFSVLIPPSTSSRILSLSLSTIKRLSNFISSWIVEEQKTFENKTQYGGENSIIELDESCFFKRKRSRDKKYLGLWFR